MITLHMPVKPSPPGIGIVPGELHHAELPEWIRYPVGRIVGQREFGRAQHALDVEGVGRMVVDRYRDGVTRVRPTPRVTRDGVLRRHDRLTKV